MPKIEKHEGALNGEFSVKISKGQIEIDKEGRIIIKDQDLLGFLKKNNTHATANLVLMGSDCGCKCCC